MNLNRGEYTSAAFVDDGVEGGLFLAVVVGGGSGLMGFLFAILFSFHS